MFFSKGTIPVIKVDESCTITDCNRRACEFIGLEAEELITRDLSEFLQTDCSTRGSFSGESDYIIGRFYHFTGEISDVVIMVNGDTSYGNQYRYMTIFDISPDRTTPGDVRNENIKNLSGRMAHDLNNILAGILGSLSILREGNTTVVEYDELLNNAEDSVIRARRITDKMLLFSRGGANPISNNSRETLPVRNQTDLEDALDSGRLLLLDDNSFVAGTTIGMLVTLGYSVDVVSEGKAVLEKYRKAMQDGDPYRVVIMDLTIEGGVGGPEAISDLLEIDPEATVILSSGFAGSNTMLNYRSFGFKASLTKPYTVLELFESINTALEQ
jgi:CheY-like chemotaxis protein/PAS domain-containing protein